MAKALEKVGDEDNLERERTLGVIVNIFWWCNDIGVKKKLLETDGVVKGLVRSLSRDAICCKVEREKAAATLWNMSINNTSIVKRLYNGGRLEVW